MSIHAPRVPTRDEVLLATSKPIPGSLKLTFVILAILGAIVFIVGAFVSPDRAWSAFHANWLFFAGLSQAGVVFVGVQRITTARWSRAVIRFMEGYVAFLPIAFVFLLLTLFVGKGDVFPWTREPRQPIPWLSIQRAMDAWPRSQRSYGGIDRVASSCSSAVSALTS